MSVMDVTGAVLGLLPDMPAPVWRNLEPGEADQPPWIIASCTTGGHTRGEGGGMSAHEGTLEVRAVTTTVDGVNVWCDDMLIPALDMHRPSQPDGHQVGPLVLVDDSGAYCAGLTADDTARRWAVRVLRFRFHWNRIQPTTS